MRHQVINFRRMSAMLATLRPIMIECKILVYKTCVGLFCCCVVSVAHVLHSCIHRHMGNKTIILNLHVQYIVDNSTVYTYSTYILHTVHTCKCRLRNMIIITYFTMDRAFPND